MSSLAIARLCTLPVTVVLKLVVASKSDKSSKTDSKRPVDLSGSIDPNLNITSLEKISSYKLLN